ncbi:hypothetical protein D3C73_1002560 [compost metagenome]
MVLAVAPQEGHLVLGPIRNPHSQNLRIKSRCAVNIHGIEHHMGDLAWKRPPTCGLLADNRVDVGGQLHQPAFGVHQLETVAARSIIQRAGLTEQRNPQGGELGGGTINVLRRGQGERDTAQGILLASFQPQDVVFGTGSAEPELVSVLLHGGKAPDFMVEIPGWPGVGHFQGHRTQRPQIADRLC